MSLDDAAIDALAGLIDHYEKQGAVGYIVLAVLPTDDPDDTVIKISTFGPAEGTQVHTNLIAIAENLLDAIGERNIQH